MALRKITIDNSVRFIPKGEPNVIKNKSVPRKQNEQTQSISKGGKINTRKKNFSQNSEKFVKSFAAKGFRILK